MTINRILLLALVILAPISALAQVSADFRPELVWTTSKNDTVTTDTAYSEVFSVGRSFPSTLAGDTTYTIIGAFENIGDTVTVTLAYRPVSPGGYPRSTWTTITDLSGATLNPGAIGNLSEVLHAGVGKIQLRAIRVKPGTQIVTTKIKFYIYNYYYAR